MVEAPQSGDNLLLHCVCEHCGRDELLTAREAYQQGWDYPPFMGAWGIVSPRTCGHCTIDRTLWWALVVEKKGLSQLTERQREALVRILKEPESVVVAAP